jgi:hypothetical protein
VGPGWRRRDAGAGRRGILVERVTESILCGVGQYYNMLAAMEAYHL